MIGRVIGLASLILCFGGGPATGQTAPSPTPPSPSPTNRVRVFLDCNLCDSEHVRQTVGFVDYVRDRTDADIHVLVTTQDTGGGGLSWDVQFIGVGRLQGQTLILTFNTASTASIDDRRSAFARIFRLGLAGPAAASSTGSQLDVTWTRPAAAATAHAADPWDSWVFNVSFNAYVNGERSSGSDSSYLQFSANRTTDRLKSSVSTYGNLSRNRFTIEGEAPIETSTHSWGVQGLVVDSVNPHWSLGATGSLSHSSFSNIDRSIGLAPAIEFNVFPYSQSSKRSLTVQYAAGVTHYKYAELTVFDRLDDMVPRQAVTGNLGLHQPWGSISLTSTLSEHLRHLDRYRASLGGEADVRLFKGFSFNVYLRYDRIRDQISLRKVAASQEDVLLRIQQLPTGYSYFANFGITYRFGSIFNNVVNTRFNNSGF